MLKPLVEGVYAIENKLGVCLEHPILLGLEDGGGRGGKNYGKLGASRLIGAVASLPNLSPVRSKR